MIPFLAIGCHDPSIAVGKDGGPADTATAADSAETGETGPDTAPDSGADTGPDDTGPDDTGPDDTAEEIPPPCTAWGEPTQTGSLVDEDLEEVSGVAASTLNPGVLWVLEDHGGEAELYAIDAEGNSLGTLTVDGVENTDWESIALAPCEEGSCLWIGDTGNNLFERTDLALIRVVEPVVGPGGDFEGSAEGVRYPFTYPQWWADQDPWNSEALAMTPEGVPIVLTKQGNGTAEVFALDGLVADVSVEARFIAEIVTREPEAEAGGFVTGADIWPDGTRLIFRTYESVYELDLGAAGIEGVATAPRVPVPFLALPHVETVAYDTVLRGNWQIPEAINAPIVFTPCLD